MSQDMGGWERVIPEEGQKNERSEKFRERARDEQNMRFCPYHETQDGDKSRETQPEHQP